MPDKQKNNAERKSQESKGQKSSDQAKKEHANDAENSLEQLKDTTTESVQAIGDKAVEMTQEAKDKINEQVSSGREAVRTSLEDTARAINQIADSDSPLIVSLKPYTSRVGTLLDDTSHYLNTVTPQRLIQDTRTLARKNPGIFVGGALALGLVAARFLKSTSDSTEDA